MTDVKKVINDISDLPTLPDVVAKLNRMISDPRTSAADINDVISRDLALSAKILKLVNSPYYGFSRRITTITYAVVILGFNTVRNLALSAFIFDAFRKRGQLFDVKEFWRHSIATAFAAAAVARVVDEEQEENAFMAGLLHGIGKVVMNQYLPDDMQKVMQFAKREETRFAEAEEQVLDYSHAELGGLLLERWNLPETIVETVLYHEHPGDYETSGEAASLCRIVHFGNILVCSLCFGSSGDERVPRLDHGVWERLGLSWEQVDTLMGDLTGEIDRADEFFSMT